MKRTFLVLIVLTISLHGWAATPATPATPRTYAVHPGLFEFGFNLGLPSGLSAKLWIDRNNALELIGAWALSRGVFSLSFDYLLNFPDILKLQTTSFPLFVGIGGIAGFSTITGAPPQVTFGLRVPVGILFVFAKVPFEISLEIVPGLNVFPDTAFLPMGGLAVRWCF